MAERVYGRQSPEEIVADALGSFRPELDRNCITQHAFGREKVDELNVLVAPAS